MARSTTAIIFALGLIACALAQKATTSASTPTPAAPCVYNVSSLTNGSTIKVSANATGKGCAAPSLLVNSLFPNETTLAHDLYESNEKNVSIVTVTADRVSNRAFLDGGVCVALPQTTGSTSHPHICALKEKNSGLNYILKASAETKDGGNFVNGSGVVEQAGIATPSTELSVFQSCGNYTSKIVDLTKTVIIGSSNDVQKLGNLKDLTLLYVVVKTHYVPDYKVVDFTNSTSKPFAQLAPIETPAAQVAANGTTNTTANGTLRAVAGSVTYTKADGTNVTLTSAPQCYSLGVTFEKLTRNPDATCYLVGCDLILIMTDGKNTFNVQTNGFESAQFEMTKLAIGLIVGIVVGVLVLCSCLIGIIFMCRKKNTGEHQPLVNH
jgi:hypothetical protein